MLPAKMLELLGQGLGPQQLATRGGLGELQGDMLDPGSSKGADATGQMFVPMVLFVVTMPARAQSQHLGHRSPTTEVLSRQLAQGQHAMDGSNSPHVPLGTSTHVPVPLMLPVRTLVYSE